MQLCSTIQTAKVSALGATRNVPPPRLSVGKALARCSNLSKPGFGQQDSLRGRHWHICNFKQEEREAAGQPRAQTAEVAGQRNILLAVDKSQESDLAVAWAVDNLLRTGDAVHLFHLAPDVQHHHVFSTPSGKLMRMDEQMVANQQEAVKKQGTQLAHDLVDRYGPRLSKMEVMVHAHVLPLQRPPSKSAIGQELCKQAADLDAAIIVVASHTHGGLMEFVRGSVSDYAVRHCTSPVAVYHSPVEKSKIKTKAHKPPTATATTTAHTPASARQLVVAVDSSPESSDACKWILDNMYRQGDVIHLVHVVPVIPLSSTITGSDYLIHSGIASDPELLERQRTLADEEAKEWFSTQADRFRHLMDKAGATHTFDIMVHQTDDPVDAISGSICSRAEELAAAAVVVGLHQQSAIDEFLTGSVTSQVTHHCTCPVVVLHMTQQQQQGAGSHAAQHVHS